MALLSRFSPLGNLTDLAGGQLDDWSGDVEGLMSKAVRGLEAFTKKGNAQFADPTVVDVGTFQQAPISWAGFPISLAAVGLSKEKQYQVADGLATYKKLSGRDAQDEYLEWYVHRDANGDVTQIDFTTEGPEYWDRLNRDLHSAGVTALYDTYYPDAKEKDLFNGNVYNRNNVFNVSRGAMHLRQAANTLNAEVEIAAQSTITYTKNGVVLTDGGDLCNEAGLGESTRASDPHIAQTVNALARDGHVLSLLDPVGLYMGQTPDFTGWKTPDGSDPKNLWVVQRGNPVTRGSLRAAAGFKLSDVTIGGQKIKYGGQVAERITVHLTALVSAPHLKTPTVVPVESLGSANPQIFSLLSTGALTIVQSRTGR